MLAQREVDANPCLVLAHADPAQAVALSRSLRQQGHTVHLAVSGHEARQLARELAPTLVVLDAQLPRESGWLTCTKLLTEQPGQRVVLLCADPTPEQRRFARFAGALGLFAHREALPSLLRELEAVSTAKI